jgi:RNA polymerase sigma factor (sigma-70 family)
MSEQDKQWIAEYDARRSEEAFAALVRQHINLVFGTAFRQVGNRSAAEEITQNVFVALAQSSGKLRSHPTIGGWLHQTTLNKSRDWLRSELRRRNREQVAVSRELVAAEGDSVWSALVPMLDEALLRLRDPDRLAVIMHFMEGQTYQQVASALGVGEDAARKRVSRSLDQLTQFFRSRGFATPSLTAGAPLFTLSAHAAPTGLASSATSAALSVAHSAASTSTFIKGALKIMAWTKTKTGLVSGACVLLAASTATLIVLQEPIQHNIALAAGRRAIADHTATPINLTAHYTEPVSFFNQITEYPVSGAGPVPVAPVGFQVFDGVPLQIDGAFFLWGRQNAAGGLVFPEKALGIEVNQKFQTLYVYNTAWFPSPDNTPVCQVVFHYDDGSMATNQLLYGSDIVEWAANSAKKANTPTGPKFKTMNDPTGPNSKAVWVGGTRSLGQNRPVRFCLTAIANPHPSLTVTSMDWFTCRSQTSACIIAMTIGRSGLMR